MKYSAIKCLIHFILLVYLIITPAAVCLAEQMVSPASSGEIEHDAKQITIRQVEPLQASVTRRYPGIIKASQQTQLAFRVGGPLIAIDVEPGEKITKGQRLMQVDPRDFKDRIAVLNAQLAAARSDLEHRQQDYARAVTLFEQQVNAKADYDRAKSAHDRAVAMEQSLEAELQIARHQLEDTCLRAPYNGMVIDQKVENYEMIQPGQVVICVQDISSLEIEIQLPENEIVKYPLRKGLSAQVQFTSIPQQRFPIYLKEWTARAHEVTRTYTLTYRFTPPSGLQILPGMTADVYLQAPARNTKLAIPADAIISSQDHTTYVWVYDANRHQVVKRSIETGGLQAKNTIELIDGLQGHEWIVVAGYNRLTDGMQVDAYTADKQRM